MNRTEQNVARDERLLKMQGAAAMTEPLAEWRCGECGFDRAVMTAEFKSAKPGTRRTCGWCGRPSTSRLRKPAGGAP